MSRRREVALELSEELGADVKDFNFAAHLTEHSSRCARLRETLVLV